MPDHAFQDVCCSLADLVGDGYVRAVCAARAAVSGEDEAALLALATTPVDFFPRAFQQRLSAMLPKVGESIISPVPPTAVGATTKSFAAATHTALAPVNGFGYYRVGEDGRLYLLTKSEHYHAPVGHGFPGYQLLEIARRLGIPNATHNNTRGHITRLLEEALTAAAGNGLDRVLNLETGSLAVEAALKMILARFYRVQEDAEPPSYAGHVPVILVMGSDDGGPQANYHGTTLFTQLMRGMWPELAVGMERAGQFAVLPIRPNRLEDVEAAFATYDGHSAGKIAGFFHEIIMMNYGARRLTPEFLRAVYRLCAAHDVPTVVDEIQSCMWAPGFFLFREWGLTPTFAAVGKGFPGGEYPASRLIFTGAMDNLPQFGALV
ncbi:MAG TPA: aminotransferase class III-fold pyridoxal phosphate-dependent enzyme, partial [Armatimonadota bacterium]|nr:aminotransferase class III-fold pyridoxal phosphate-dependent enzyme [Armatimonadota bacterium]